LEFVKIFIFITVDIFKHTAKKNKKIKRADQILPEVYGTTFNNVKLRSDQSPSDIGNISKFWKSCLGHFGLFATKILQLVGLSIF